MKITSTILASLLAATALAAPAAVAEQSMMAVNTPQWTIENMRRVCNSADTTCTYTFHINTKGPSSTNCKYVHNGHPASRTSGGPAYCGKFSVTSGWSGQFGPGKGFTVLSVVHTKARQIIYPGYTDIQLAKGKVVRPNQSYTPQSLPR